MEERKLFFHFIYSISISRLEAANAANTKKKLLRTGYTEVAESIFLARAQSDICFFFYVL